MVQWPNWESSLSYSVESEIKVSYTNRHSQCPHNEGIDESLNWFKPQRTTIHSDHQRFLFPLFLSLRVDLYHQIMLFLVMPGEFSSTGPVSYSTASTPSSSATNNVSDSFSSEITLDSPSSVTMDTSFHYEYDSFYGADFVSEFSAAGAYYTPVYWEICSLRRDELKNITFYWMVQPNVQKVVFWNIRSKRVWSNWMFLCASSVPNVVRPKARLKERTFDKDFKLKHTQWFRLWMRTEDV